jgi:hypothetical protein
VEIMQNDYSNVFTLTELDYLRTEADDYGWYVWTEESRPIIEALCTRRLMAPNGDFKVVGYGGEANASQAGHGTWIKGTVSRYFELIGVGRIAFHALNKQEPHKTMPTLALAMQDTKLRHRHA